MSFTIIPNNVITDIISRESSKTATEIPTNRPIYEKLLARSTKDWGEAPRYNEDYRKIRWPGSAYERGHDGTISVCKPVWMSNLEYQMRRKADGNWNRGSAGPWGKRDTAAASSRDLVFALTNNIPYKGKTVEYKPQDQWIRCKGIPFLKYSIETGRFSHFTFSGQYDKTISFLLRKYGINIKKIRGLLMWKTSHIGDISIELDHIYSLEEESTATLCSILVDRNLAIEFASNCDMNDPRLFSWIKDKREKGGIVSIHDILRKPGLVFENGLYREIDFRPLNSNLVVNLGFNVISPPIRNITLNVEL